MARSLAALLLLLVAAAGDSHAASPAEMYWKIALPTSPMPGAIRDLINPASSAGSASKEDTVGNVFFLEKDLFPGSKLTLHFTRATAGAALLPRGRADSVPLATEKLLEILSQLSVPAGSPAADAMSARPRRSPARRSNARRRSSPWWSSPRPASAPATCTPCPRRSTGQGRRRGRRTGWRP
ncbi:hypothetical protein DAI22_05g075800 [Oryza sativa Japonica Group]|nr:hypothetical protein DAI22_05g075800 [Oryza sativa Japonica Group]